MPFEAELPGRSSVLSFIAGYVDTAVFIGLFGLFTAHVTGNFVLIGSELVHRSGEVWPKLLAFPAFILGVAATVKIAEARSRSGRTAVAVLLYVEAALLLAAFVAPTLEHPLRDSDASALAGGLAAATAMGMQNALMRIELASLPSTTVMTINVTQSVIDIVTRLSSGADAAHRDEARKRFGRMWPHIVAFTLGAAAGAIVYALAQFAALLVPSALCVVLGALWQKSPPLRP